MSSQTDTLSYLGLSIGEERNDAGEPLVCVLGVGILGTLADVKQFIATYERHRGTGDEVGTKIADAIAAYDREVLPHRLASFNHDRRGRG